MDLGIHFTHKNSMISLLVNFTLLDYKKTNCDLCVGSHVMKAYLVHLDMERGIEIKTKCACV
jgi:hypothetical protein